MRRTALLAVALALAGCSGGASTKAAPPARPMRVMSMNQCTDQLVLALLPPERIASVTWLSRDPRYSAMVATAERVAINRGAVEEVVATRPDLIVTDTFSDPAGRALLGRLHYPVLAIDDGYDVAAIRANLRRLAVAFGEVARGEALVAAMDRELHRTSRAPRLRVAAWGRDGLAESPLLAAAIAAAGLIDVTPATGPGDVETLLALAPDLLVENDGGSGGATLGDLRREHPLIRQRWPAGHILHVAAADTICGTPAVGHAATTLRAQAAAAGTT